MLTQKKKKKKERKKTLIKNCGASSAIIVPNSMNSYEQPKANPGKIGFWYRPIQGRLLERARMVMQNPRLSDCGPASHGLLSSSPGTSSELTCGPGDDQISGRRSTGEGLSPGALVVKDLNAKDRETGVPSPGREDTLEEGTQPTSVFLPGECHGQRSLVGYSPRGHKESDTTEVLSTHHVLGWSTVSNCDTPPGPKDQTCHLLNLLHRQVDSLPLAPPGKPTLHSRYFTDSSQEHSLGPSSSC